MQKITKIYLPVKNEEIDLETSIKQLRKFSNDEIIVVDNNSTDNSRKIASNLANHVWDQSKSGKGNVIKKIIKESDADIIFFTDADNTYDVSMYEKHKKMMLIKDYDREKCFQAFRNNNWVGMVIFIGAVLGTL